MADHQHHHHDHKQLHEQPYVAYVPEPAKGHPIDQTKKYYLENLGENTFFVSDGMYHIMVCETDDSLILVDAPPSFGRNGVLFNAIKEIGKGKPVKTMIYSHSHWDHIGLAGEVKKTYPEVQIIAHEETKKQLELSNDANRPVPHITFDKEHDLKHGNVHLELRYKGVNHDIGNIFVYAPKPKVLMIIDVIFPGWVPYEGIAMSAYLKGWFQAHRQILEYDFKVLISGHLTRYGTRKDVEVQIEFYKDLRKYAAEAKKAVQYGDLLAKFGHANLFKLTKEYNDEIANFTAKKMLEAGWRDRLGAIDEYLWNAAWEIGEMHNLEGSDYSI